MGYYAHAEGNVVIDGEKINDAHQALIALNARHDLKRGGSNAFRRTRPDSVGVSNKWFSYMDWDYDATCRGLDEILHQVGFHTTVDPNKALVITGFGGKIGQENVFLATLAHYINPGGHLLFTGEDEEQWSYSFDGQTMTVV